MTSPTTARRTMLRSAAMAALVSGLPHFAFAQTATPRPTAEAVKVAIDVAAAKPISNDLIGIFFEDINDAADGGLYAELVQNRSFEYTPADNPEWRPLTAWRLVADSAAEAKISTAKDNPLNENNRTHAVLSVGATTDAPTRVINDGFGGIVVMAGENYDASLFARKLDGDLAVTAVRLETTDGRMLA